MRHEKTTSFQVAKPFQDLQSVPSCRDAAIRDKPEYRAELARRCWDLFALQE